MRKSVGTSLPKSSGTQGSLYAAISMPMRKRRPEPGPCVFTFRPLNQACSRASSQARARYSHPNDPEMMALGEKMYNTYCIPCHGAAGKGDGSITDLYPRPPDITADIYKKRGDGFFFHRITFGANIMPAYGYATTLPERWAVVHYVRKLQGESK